MSTESESPFRVERGQDEGEGEYGIVVAACELESEIRAVVGVNKGVIVYTTVKWLNMVSVCDLTKPIKWRAPAAEYFN